MYQRRPVHKMRKKVFVIPYFVDDADRNRQQVLMVKDRKTNEWGFISGGVKNHETYFQAAERELFEETSGGMDHIPEEHGKSTFKTMYRPDELLRVNKNRGEIVSSNYCVFWIPISPRFARRLESEFVPNEEVKEVRVDEYFSFRNRWVVCDMFMDSLLHAETTHNTHTNRNRNRW